MMELRVAGFDWDDGNRLKCQKHGVPIAEVEGVFENGPLIAPDPRHSAGEDRLIAIGRSGANRPIFVAFTLRTVDGHTLIRPVSARYMHAKEVAAYEKAGAEAENR